jgi:Fur family transcriptional regulator, ferric uptake regulator
MKQAIRMTKRRSLVLDILRERGHLDAYELLELARQKDSRISLATVYRALAYFRERDVIRGRTFGEGHTHFEIHDAETGSHAHFVCTGCGRLREITGRFMEDLEQLARKEKFSISRVHLDMFGLCEECADKNPCKDSGRM